jgi:hypothetical protein
MSSSHLSLMYYSLFSKKGRGLRHFFSTSSAPKFHRGPLAPGRAYLACVLFHEDRVLMTGDDALPAMEATGEAPASAQQASADLLWLAKLARAWTEVERLRTEASKAGGGAAKSVNRTRLLHAALAMQQALGTVDLGEPFHRPLVHPSGSVVFSLVRRLPSGRPPPPSLPLNLK